MMQEPSYEAVGKHPAEIKKTDKDQRQTRNDGQVLTCRKKDSTWLQYLGKVGWQKEKGGVRERESARGRRQGVLQSRWLSCCRASRGWARSLLLLLSEEEKTERALFCWTKLRDVRSNIEYQQQRQLEKGGF